MYQFTWWFMQKVVRRCTSQQFWHNNPESSIFALANKVSLLLFIFDHLQVYKMENESFWQEGDLSFLYIDLLNFFVFSTDWATSGANTSAVQRSIYNKQ